MAHEIRVNMDKALCLSHAFHLLLGAGRAALLPFLSLYFRLLGLSATQTGLIFGAKSFMTMCCTPAWTTCAKRFNTKKIVLMFSLFMMLVMHLMLCLVPPADKQIPLAFCDLGLKNGTEGDSHIAAEPLANTTLTNQEVPGDSKNLMTKTTTMGIDFNEFVTDAKTSNFEEGVGSKDDKESKLSTKTSTTIARSTPATTSTTTSTTGTTSTTTSTPATTSTSAQKLTSTLTTQTKSPWISFSTDDTNNKPKNDNENSNSQLTDEELQLLSSLNLSLKDLEALSTEDLNKLAEKLSGVDSDSPSKYRHRRNLVDSVRNKWEELSNRFDLAEYKTFVFILMLMIVGELFAAPHEKLADDCWFEYLDILDGLEHYGGHRIWLTVGFVIMPAMIGAVVDHTPCVLPFGIHHILIHFFVFAVVTGIAFMMALCFPVSHHKQTAKRSRLGRGLRILCGDLPAISMAVTMTVVGIASAVINNFLFWRVQDLGGPEIAMGICIAVAAGAEFVVRLIGHSLVRKLTHIGTVCLALLLLIGVLVFYSFLWSPWLAVAGAAFHGLGITLLWIAVQTFPDFRINPFTMDRSAASLMNALNLGIGFTSGSMLSGIIYDRLGYMIMFQGTAGLLGLWLIIFIILQKVGKKKEKVRYAKLLQDENMEDSEEDVYEDDWLEVAMKRDR